MVAALATRASPREARDTPFTGVWAGERKIGSIGVHVSRGVTTHGLAVNVDNDLQPFEWIVPCGIDHVRMTSVSRETGRARACRASGGGWRTASPRPPGGASGSSPSTGSQAGAREMSAA